MSTLVTEAPMAIADNVTIRASYATADAIERGDRVYTNGQFRPVLGKSQVGGAVVVFIDGSPALQVSPETVLSYI